MKELPHEPNPNTWRTKILDKFLIIHESHSTGLCTMKGNIAIEDIPNLRAEIKIAFRDWLLESKRCENNTERMQAHYDTGVALARHIKATVGDKVLVDFWCMNPSLFEKNFPDRWIGQRIDFKGYKYFPNEYEQEGWIPASPFDIEDAMGGGEPTNTPTPNGI